MLFCGYQSLSFYTCEKFIFPRADDVYAISMSVIINEWLPNPVGDDAAGEWIELFNPDPPGGAPQTLSGYRIENGAGKKYLFTSVAIDPQEYLLLPRTLTKLTLRNQDETLSLYNSAGATIDESHFVGTAPEGKSFGRVGAPNGADASAAARTAAAARSMFLAPTPGEPNQLSQTASAVSATAQNFSYGIPLNPSHPTADAIFGAIALGVGLSYAINTIIGRNEELSNLFFK